MEYDGVFNSYITEKEPEDVSFRLKIRYGMEFIYDGDW